MSNAKVSKMLTEARQLLAQPLTFAELLAQLNHKDRVNAQRRVTSFDVEPAPEWASLWQRLACTLMTLAPDAKFVGRSAVQFFAPDGRYRMQVFALEDTQNGNVTVYCPDVLPDAVEAGLLVPSDHPEPHVYVVARTCEPIKIEALDGTALNPEAHFKNLTNWKRKALRIILPPSPSPAQVEAVELLCAIAARHFELPAPQDGDVSPAT